MTEYDLLMAFISQSNLVTIPQRNDGTNHVVRVVTDNGGTSNIFVNEFIFDKESGKLISHKVFNYSR